jgi:hypothetical protein
MFSNRRHRSFYMAFAQNEKPQMSVLVETVNPDASALAGLLRDVVRALDVEQPVFNLQTFSSFYAREGTGVQLLVLRTAAAMGLLGLMLALVGLYGLVTYSVSRRTREFGIRMAVGAGRRNILTMVLREGLLLSVTGIIVGAVASIVVARLLTAGVTGLGRPESLSLSRRAGFTDGSYSGGELFAGTPRVEDESGDRAALRLNTTAQSETLRVIVVLYGLRQNQYSRQLTTRVAITDLPCDGYGWRRWSDASVDRPCERSWTWDAARAAFSRRACRTLPCDGDRNRSVDKDVVSYAGLQRRCRRRVRVRLRRSHPARIRAQST